MQKLKKALNLLKKTASLKAKPAQAAKKAPAAKSKSAPVAQMKKGGPKKPAGPAHPPKKAAHKAPPHKGKPHGGHKPEAKAAGHKHEGKHAAPKHKQTISAKKSQEKAPIQVIHKKVAPKPQPEVKGKKAEAPVKELEQKAKPVEAKAPAKPEIKVEPKGEKLKARKKDEVAIEESTESNGREEVVLTDAEGRRYCRLKDCDQIATVDGGYCRYHYLLFWKNIQVRKKILSEGKLERYIEELTARYPDKYLEMLKKDLRSEKDFMAAIQELEIDDSGVDNEYEDEAQSYLEEVRGMGGGEAGATRGDDEDF